MNIILTVPHAICPPSQGDIHWCDSSAEFNAYFIFKWIQEISPAIKVSMLLASTFRPDCDENRAQCRHTPFRKRVDSLIVRAKTVLVDVHSFPPSKGSFGEPDVEVVLLYLGRLDVHTQDLIDTLEGANIAVRALQGSNENDILYKSRKDVVYSILLEFNEALSNRRSLRISSVVARWLVFHVT